ncbi:MraY family glycosyltransferase [Pirellulales bacterium]|nr:MraY family glycosyltransferase [Pirellulales bacterium]
MIKNLFMLAAAGVVVAYVVTRIVRAVAWKLDFVDRPDGHHKSHKQAVALGGGLAVFLSVVITLVLAVAFGPHMHVLAQPYMDGLLLGGAWIVALGLFDDRYGMPGRYKLLGQILAALIMVSEGMVIEAFVAFEYKVTLGALAIPFTVFWLVGAINSLNLLDGIDGLATTIGIVLCAAIVVVSVAVPREGTTAVAIIATIVGASLFGFLRFNFPPATMFLGDAGSMLIGLIVGTLAITASMKGPATVALAAPLAIWALPMFDSVTAVLRRKLTGRSIYATDRGHLHHRLMSVFVGRNALVVFVVAACCIITCAGALASMLMHNDLIAMGSIAIVVCMLVLTRAFGYVEVRMLASRASSFGRSLLRSGNMSKSHDFAFQIQGNRDWDPVWKSIAELAEELDLVEVKLDINVASIQEGYHAALRRPTVSDRMECWRIDIPLFSGPHVVGRLRAVGTSDAEASACQVLRTMIEKIEPLEGKINALSEETKSEASSRTSGQSSEPDAGQLNDPSSPAIASLES